ncbi:hypothetical protein PILCRDRAFT_821629 [Piloderma croceum F 1598]|uniref:C3H1-type domain-containing protein n=1 Tax=Piloderma croceum (strain F 1598) TaxID=765440 RepID=A0A0C3B4R0_PILCF|nr:hypothetical protein PILCRDRAFT_821629 [Piloderma croceum F 1598]
MLFQSVRQYFLSTFSLDVDQKNFWVHVFYNKRGLMDALGHAGHWAAKQGFEDFSIGFNQAAERFVMVDVGNGKEAADAKVKVMLDDFIQSPQTSKILFGGCHDNGYITSLRSAMTGGFKDKLVLLRGYKVSEAGIDKLGLPSMTIANLFLETKLIPSPHSPIPEQRSDSWSPVSENGARPAGQLNYASVASTPKLDVTGNTNDDHRASPKTRHINPNIQLSKHNPPPCTLHYLAHCKFGAGCKYGHNYLLEPEHYDTIRENAKKSPCPAVNRNEECTYYDYCCYGHFCPHGTKCYFNAMGTCKFVGARMHKGNV